MHSFNVFGELDLAAIEVSNNAAGLAGDKDTRKDIHVWLFTGEVAVDLTLSYIGKA